MEYRSLSLAASLILCLLAGGALAEESGPSPEQQADWQQRLDKSAAMLAEAREREKAADNLLKQKDKACYERIFVNSCRSDARDEHIAATREIRRLENEGKAIERQVKKEQLADKDKRRADAAPEKAAELEQRKVETAAERQAAEEKEAATLADKERKAAEGAKRKAAEAEKHRKKVEEHEAKVAAQKAKAEKRAAESGKDK